MIIALLIFASICAGMAFLAFIGWAASAYTAWIEGGRA